MTGRVPSTTPSGWGVKTSYCRQVSLLFTFLLLYILILFTSHNNSQRKVILLELGFVLGKLYLTPYCEQPTSPFPDHTKIWTWILTVTEEIGHFHSAAFLCSPLDFGSLLVGVGENPSMELAMSLVTLYPRQSQGSSRRNTVEAAGNLPIHAVLMTLPPSRHKIT